MQLNIKSQATLNHNCLDLLYASKMTIGDRIRELRERNNLSGERFAELCDVTKGAVSQWESNSSMPGIDRLLKLKEKLDFSIDYILTGEASMAEQIAHTLTAEQLRAWYRVGNSLAEPDEGTNGKQ